MSTTGAPFSLVSVETREPAALSMQRLWLTGQVLPAGTRLTVEHVFRSVLVRNVGQCELRRTIAAWRLCCDHGCPDCRNGLWSAGKLPDLKLVFPDFRCKLNAADRDRCCIEGLSLASVRSVASRGDGLAPPHYSDICLNGRELASASFRRPSVPEPPDAKPHRHRA
jgi:hypothetical protein